MANLQPVDYDPFAPPKPVARSRTAEPKLTPVSGDPFAATSKPTSKAYLPGKDFSAEMDATFGAGKWRATGDYRSPERENQLRAQGAQTVRAGRTSQHSMGTPDAPGAHDIVVQGMTPDQAAKVLQKKGHAFKMLPEGSAGGQGAHLHVNLNPITMTPVDHDPFGSTPNKPVSNQPPKTGSAGKQNPVSLTPVNHNPFNALVDSFADIPKEIGKEDKEAMEQLGSDFTKPLDRKKGAILARGVKTTLDAVGLPFTPITGAATSIVGRPVEAVTGIPKELTGDIVSMAAPFAGEIKGAKAGQEMARLAKPTERILSSATVSDESRAAAMVHRKALGSRTAEADRVAARLEHHQKIVGNLPVDQQRAIVDAVENKSKGFKIADPKLQPVVDDLAATSKHYKDQIEYVMNRASNGKAVPKFVEDYYSHMWKEKPSVVSEKMGTFARQGSGKNLKARTIPTLADGIAAGLTPRYENPVDTMTAYAANMSRFLATHDIQSDLKDMGLARFHSGQAPPGMVPLKGILTEKLSATIDKTTGEPRAIQQKLYAPEDVARIYNNSISKGLDQGDVGPVYRGARALSNGVVQLTLGLSGFHAGTMASEGMASELAKAAKQFSRGEALTGAKTVLKAPGAAVSLARQGAKFKKMVLEQVPVGTFDRKVVDNYIESGQRLKMDAVYRTRPAGSFFQSMERGTFKRDLSDSVKALYTGSLGERAKGVVDLGANMIQTTAAPIFEKYVPSMKQGAFYSTMSDWLRTNPNATVAEQRAYAASLGDSIDNRFGEMVQDNLFWHKATSQIAQILMLSPSWNLGTVREIGGGVAQLPASLKAILKGKGATDKTAYLAGLAASTLLLNGTYEYMKTGKMPEGEDWLAPRTGGTNATDGSAERAYLPGYSKDVIAFLYDFPHNIPKEMANKLNPALRQMIELGSNKDYRGDPIYRPDGVAPVEGQPGRAGEVAQYLMKENTPISLQNRGKKGSNIGIEGLVGVRDAPGFMQNPGRVAGNRTRYGSRDYKKKIKADAKEKAMEQ